MFVVFFVLLSAACCKIFSFGPHNLRRRYKARAKIEARYNPRDHILKSRIKLNKRMI